MTSEKERNSEKTTEKLSTRVVYDGILIFCQLVIFGSLRGNYSSVQEKCRKSGLSGYPIFEFPLHFDS